MVTKGRVLHPFGCVRMEGKDEGSWRVRCQALLMQHQFDVTSIYLYFLFGGGGGISGYLLGHRVWEKCRRLLQKKLVENLKGLRRARLAETKRNKSS